MAKKKTNRQLEAQNAAKTLLANIRFLSPDKPIRSIALTSSIPDEGKTTTLVQLANAIASSGKTVLAVECDMRKCDLSTKLGSHAPAGLYSVITNETSLDDAIVETSTPNLFFLDVEPGIPNPTDIIASDGFQKLVSKLSDKYDFVLYDTPPVGTFVDAALLSAHVDGTIMVIRMNGPKRDELAKAYEQLKKSGGNVIGSVATFCEERDSSYYYYDNYGTGSYGRSNASGANTGNDRTADSDDGLASVPRHSHKNVTGNSR